MINNKKTLIEHIPKFLNYCGNEGLKHNTQENYKRFLNKFINWLKCEKLSSLLPHQLVISHIYRYKTYLSKNNYNKGQPLKKVTQNYYLIALRGLLSYFVAKNIVSLPPNKITLYSSNKSVKNQTYPNLEQIKALLEVPQGKTLITLRDRAILHIIISTGLKIRQLTALNKNSVGSLPEDIMPYIKDYLETRKNDDEEALFINYSGRKSASRRLTPRAIEKTIKRYCDKAKLPISITPEMLRSANILATWNKKIEIKNLYWQKVEDAINQRIILLKENVSTLPEKYKSQATLARIVKCDDCIFRKIAILIVADLVKCQKMPILDIWPGFCFDKKDKKLVRHGADWHKKMINSIVQYFEKSDKKNKITIEPILNYGRADIGININKENDKSIYIEIGTVSLFKIWYNLMVMPNSIFILVPDDNFIIKFEN